MNKIWTNFIWLCLLTMKVHGIMFNLEPNTQKCLKDEVQLHQLIVIEFEVSNAPGHQIDYVVNDSRKHFSKNYILFCCQKELTKML